MCVVLDQCPTCKNHENQHSGPQNEHLNPTKVVFLIFVITHIFKHTSPKKLGSTVFETSGDVMCGYCVITEPFIHTFKSYVNSFLKIIAKPR
jgi:hypothetical protein